MKNLNFKWILLLVLSILLISCASDDLAIANTVKDVAISGLEVSGVSSEEIEEVTDSLVEVTGGLDNVVEMVSDYADEMNISQGELEEMIHELSLIDAHKNSIGIGEYLESLESNGQTAFEVQKLLADNLGMTIVELYNYQVYNDGELSEEQQENNNNIANALNEISNLNLTSNSESIEEVSGDIDELLEYNAFEIIRIEDDEFGSGCQFLTHDSMDEVSEYYIELLSGTMNFTSIVIAGEGAQVTGTINEAYVFILMEYSGESISVTYSYMK